MTLETVIDSLNSDEIHDLCFCLNRFAEPKTGVYANQTNVKFYRLKYASKCVERALQDNDITGEGIHYITRLQMKLENF
jgi:hypothetical protein